MRAWIIGLAVALGACGGGGDSAPPPTPSATATNPRAAWMSLLTNTRTYSVAGTGGDGRQYGVSLTIAPGAGLTSSDGTAFPSATFTTRLARNGAPLSSTFAEYAYEAGTGRVMFIVYGGGGCAALSASYQVPASAGLGAAGPMFSGRYSPACITLGAQALTATWSFEADGANGMLCINQRREGLAVHSESWCVAASAAGVPLSAARVSISDGSGFSLTAR